METFVGNTIKLVLKTHVDLSGYGNLYIRYQKPDGTRGYWEASVSSENNTWMEYTTLSTDIDQAGDWVLEAYVEGVGVYLFGKWADLKVYTPLQITSLLPLVAGLAAMSATFEAVKL